MLNFFFTNNLIHQEYLRTGHDRVRVHNPVGVLLPDLGDKESAHAGAGAAAQGVGQLEALRARELCKCEHEISVNGE